jgi:hypothetical protein
LESGDCQEIYKQKEILVFMALIKPADGVIFAKDELENEFNSFSEGDWLKKAISRAIDDLNYNVFCGRKITKKLIPKTYVQKYGIDNLWWYGLPNAWRLVYSVLTPSNEEILCMIVEWFDHKDYERRFGYG